MTVVTVVAVFSIEITTDFKVFVFLPFCLHHRSTTYVLPIYLILMICLTLSMKPLEKSPFSQRPEEPPPGIIPWKQALGTPWNPWTAWKIFLSLISWRNLPRVNLLKNSTLVKACEETLGGIPWIRFPERTFLWNPFGVNPLEEDPRGFLCSQFLEEPHGETILQSIHWK